ncbi:hypothetical protein C8R44DRAFT_732042 [Mycena epipterygia]|nr:hypothetical protein C8R44DRAFT_732042 [Mycena epipterygia]
MNDEAELHLLKSEYAKARSIHTEILENTQDTWNCAFGLLNMAQIDIVIGASAQDVHQNLDKVKEISNSSGNLYPLNYCEIFLAELNLREGETHTAKPIFQQCFTSVAHNNSQAALECMESLADTNQWPGCNFGLTSRWTVVYLVYAQGKRNKWALHKALQYLGDVFLKQGDLNTAGSLFTAALDTFTYIDIHQS